MRRLCDSWTKSEDNKADTSRMDDDDEEVVKMENENDIEMLKTEVDSNGHIPREICGNANVNKTTQELGQEIRDEGGIPRRPRCRSWSYHYCLYTYMR